MLDENTRKVDSFDKVLRDALKSRVARDLVRKVHPRKADVDLLTSIDASLTPDDESIRRSSIVSIFLTDVDVTNFFARHRFPKLQHLYLSQCTDLALDHLKSSTTALIGLSLHDNTLSPVSVPSTSQLLSLLSSNPHLQTVTLSILAVNDDIESECDLQVPLPHLKGLTLTMDFRPALAILQRLKFPAIVLKFNLFLQGCTLEAARCIIGPYIRDRLQDGTVSGNTLGIIILSTCTRVSLKVSVVYGWDRELGKEPLLHLPHATLTMILPRHISREERDQLCVDILAFFPRERVVYLKNNLSTDLMEELLITMPNIEVLCLENPLMSESFLLPDPDGPNAHKKLLPSLKCLYLKSVVAGGNWDPLIRYLTHQTSGDQSIILDASGEGVHICPGVRKQIKDLIHWFFYYLDLGENYDWCSECQD